MRERRDALYEQLMRAQAAQRQQQQLANRSPDEIEREVVDVTLSELRNKYGNVLRAPEQAL